MKVLIGGRLEAMEFLVAIGDKYILGRRSYLLNIQKSKADGCEVMILCWQKESFSKICAELK